MTSLDERVTSTRVFARIGKDEQDTQQRRSKLAFHAKCPTREATQGG